MQTTAAKRLLRDLGELRRYESELVDVCASPLRPRGTYESELVDAWP